MDSFFDYFEPGVIGYDFDTTLSPYNEDFGASYFLPSGVDYIGGDEGGAVPQDNEWMKFLRQQETAQSGESPLGGIGPNAESLPLVNTNTNLLSKLFGSLKSGGQQVAKAAVSPGGLMGILGALLANKFDKAPAQGGGVGAAYAGAKPITRTIEQGKYGPIARYAADGGIMNAYAYGGSVSPFPMQDGGFVMTKKAVDGAGGAEGIKRVLPGARMIGGPPDPTGRRDLTPAVIHGPRGQTPARVSNGEAYIPPGRDTKGLYALMKHLEGKAA